MQNPTLSIVYTKARSDSLMPTHYIATEKYTKGQKIQFLLTFHSIPFRLYGGEPGNEAISMSSEEGCLPRNLVSALATLRGNGFRCHSPLFCMCTKLQ